ncbi:MAG: phospho-N-acetylmuramoyl-pentapeptide-transferase [Candidatus Omnitrophota bacterium]
MFHYLASLRDVFFGFNIFKYITFRAGMAAVTTFVLCLILGPFLIRKFKSRNIRENVKREYCDKLDPLQKSKEGTPTMGGIFIIGSIVLSILLWGDLTNKYTLIALVTCIWLAVLGGIDDYIKLTHKGKKRGLSALTKFTWQLVLGFSVGCFVYLDPTTSTKLDLPFVKESVIDLGMFYIPFVMLVIVGASNAVNLTDGLDGLAIGCTLMVALTLSVLSYVTGHLRFSEYLFIPYIPGTGELAVFCMAMVGASLGFLWFNCYPASIFMGDVGSLALGGSIGVISVLIKKELLLVFLGGVFVVEVVSVMLQIFVFKVRRKRLFKMSPVHHHLQLSGWDESKIIVRFWIIAIILALLTLTTLKIR